MMAARSGVRADLLARLPEEAELRFAELASLLFSFIRSSLVRFTPVWIGSPPASGWDGTVSVVSGSFP